ncbi:hypothetical protein KD27_02295 [Smithella sp. D17]|nr:hypothetical protein KD27_02295 [Smithella sp. D17]
MRRAGCRGSLPDYTRRRRTQLFNVQGSMFYVEKLRGLYVLSKKAGKSEILFVENRGVRIRRVGRLETLKKDGER